MHKIKASTGIVHSIIWEGSQAELKPDLLDQLPPEKSIMMVPGMYGLLDMDSNLIYEGVV